MAKYSKYLKEMSKNFGMYASWTPGTPIELGDVGEFKDGIFRRKTTLASMGFAFEVRTSPKPETLDHKSGKDVSVRIKAQGDAVPAGSALADIDAGFSIGFGKSGGVLFQAVDVYDHSIEDQLPLKGFLLEKYGDGTLEKNWVVVTDLKKTGNTTVIYSNNSNGQIDLKANANVGTDSFSLTDAELQLGVKWEKNMETKVIAQAGLTPLFKVVGLRRRLFRKDTVESRRVRDAEAAEKAGPLTLSDIGEIKPMRNIYALLVGVDKYEYISDLGGCENDVKRFGEYLKSLPDDHLKVAEPKLLLSEDATKENIVKAFNDYLGQAQQDDLCIFYFSGHGAQETAGDAFKDEHDGKIEVRACHDSSSAISGSFLADKEIRRLVRQLTDKGAETLVVLDSCHSGDGSRGIMQARRLGSTVPQRQWKDFIFGDNFTEEEVRNAPSFDALMPLSDYVNLSACEAEQSAWEVGGSGVFSANLLQLLQQTGGNLSYGELHSRLRLLIDAKLFRGQSQTPQMDCNPEELVRRTVFGEMGRDRPLQSNATFSENRWWVDIGAVHGLQANGTSPEVEIVDGSGKLLTTACIPQICPAKSVLDLDDGTALDQGQTYTARVHGLFLPKLNLLLTGDNEGVETAKAYFGEKGAANLQLTYSPANANYVLKAENGVYSLADPEFLKPVVRQESSYDEGSLNQIGEYLKGMSKWEFVKNMRQPEGHSRHISDGKGIDFVLEWMDEKGSRQEPSTESIDSFAILEQKGLPKPEKPMRGGEEASKKGLETRGWPSGGDTLPKAEFWFTQLLGISHPNPDFDEGEYGA